MPCYFGTEEKSTPAAGIRFILPYTYINIGFYHGIYGLISEIQHLFKCTECIISLMNILKYLLFYYFCALIDNPLLNLIMPAVELFYNRCPFSTLYQSTKHNVKVLIVNREDILY